MKKSYGGVLIGSDGRVLLRKTAGTHASSGWTFAKGRPDAGEEPEQAALREVKEEMGIDAEIVCPVPGNFSGTATVAQYWLMKPIVETGEFDSETQVVMWASIEQAQGLIAKTGNPTKRKRDLAILDAAVHAWQQINAHPVEKKTMPVYGNPYPYDKTWWITQGRVMGGCYPGTLDPKEQAKMIGGLLDLGIKLIINLQEPDEIGRGGKKFADYTDLAMQLAKDRNVVVEVVRFPVKDQSIPTPEVMKEILARIMSAVEHEKRVYIHCWGGNGRTGTVAGCWLVNQGCTTQQAFDKMAHDRQERGFTNSAPENETQRNFVRQWAKSKMPTGAKACDATSPFSSEVDRAMGALVGLAVGDAVGTTVEFKAPGSFSPVSDMVGGGPFGLKVGQWTDDTSMALCLAQSLIDCDGFDPRDQIAKYCKWWKEGYFSATGKCFDIGITVSGALTKHLQTHAAYCGSTSPSKAGNGSLMRLSPVAIRYAHEPLRAIVLAGESSRTTHGARECVDACRYFAGLLAGLISGASKDEVLQSLYVPGVGANLWDIEPLAPKVMAIAKGSFKTKQPPAIRGTGYVVDALEAALWAFHTTDNFKDAILAATNLGEDADTTAAICGQIAGAWYGLSGIPQSWLDKLAMRNEIEFHVQKLISNWT